MVREEVNESADIVWAQFQTQERDRERGGERVDGYDYRVIFITDYLTIITQVNLMPNDDNFNNLSAEAYEQAVINAENNIIDELGSFDESIVNDITVSLLLDDEEIELTKEII